MAADETKNFVEREVMHMDETKYLAKSRIVGEDEQDDIDAEDYEEDAG